MICFYLFFHLLQISLFLSLLLVRFDYVTWDGKQKFYEVYLECYCSRDFIIPFVVDGIGRRVERGGEWEKKHGIVVCLLSFIDVLRCANARLYSVYCLLPQCLEWLVQIVCCVVGSAPFLALSIPCAILSGPLIGRRLYFVCALFLILLHSKLSFVDSYCAHRAKDRIRIVWRVHELKQKINSRWSNVQHLRIASKYRSLQYAMGPSIRRWVEFPTTSEKRKTNRTTKESEKGHLSLNRIPR